MSSGATKALHSPAGSIIEITKWKVRKGSKIDPGSVLMTYKLQGDNNTKKLKSQQLGVVVELLKKEGEIVQPSQQLLMLAGCSHNIVIKDLCAECGKDLREEDHEEATNLDSFVDKSNAPITKKASVAMIHSVPELVVTDKHAQEIGKADVVRLRKSKKLVLLVDLDQTLIHTTTDNIPNDVKGVHHFQMGRVWYHTKFRPGTELFLRTISTLYELHIVTFGVRLYAHTIAKMMDPEGKYFSHRILSRDELLDANTKKANLKSLFPCGEDMVAIIDDREDVWNYSNNVIPVLPYRFFTGTGDINAPGKKSSTIKNSTDSTAKSSTDDTNSSGGSLAPLTVDVSDSKLVTEASAPTESSSGGQAKRPSEDADGAEAKKQKVDTNETPAASNLNVTETPCAHSGVCDVITSSTNEQSETLTVNIDGTNGEKLTNDPASSDAGNEKEAASCDSVEKKSEEEVEGQHDTEQETVDNELEKKQTSDAKTADGEVVADEKVKDEVVWGDNDNYLKNLTDILVEVHHEFFKRESNPVTKSSTDAKAQTVAAVLTSHRKEVLEDCVLAFSGLFPQSQSLYHSTAYSVASKLGAKVAVNVEDNVTHLVASRLGTKKVRQAAGNSACTIVHPDWLWLSWYNFHRESELGHILTKSNEIPEPKSGNVPFMCGLYDPSMGRKRKLPDQPEVDEEEIRKVKIADVEVDYEPGSEDDTVLVAEGEDLDDVEEGRKQRFSDTLNPLITFDNDDISAMDAEIDEAFESSSSSDESTTLDKELRKKVLSSDEHNSDSEESLSNDYPKGWGPKVKRKSSPHDAYDELAEEEQMRRQEAAENSPMEFGSSDEEDDLMAAEIDKAFLES